MHRKERFISCLGRLGFSDCREVAGLSDCQEVTAVAIAAQASPIVRVAVEPARPTDLAQLEEGLKLLNQADPFVEVTTQDSGEHVIGAAGAALPAMRIPEP